MEFECENKSSLMCVFHLLGSTSRTFYKELKLFDKLSLFLLLNGVNLFGVYGDLGLFSSSSNKIYSSIKHTRKSILVLPMTQSKEISVSLIEHEAPNNLTVFRVKVLSVNAHVLLQ